MKDSKLNLRGFKQNFVFITRGNARGKENIYINGCRIMRD
jgi:hypothetical protein